MESTQTMESAMRYLEKVLDDWLFSAGLFVTGIFIVSLVGADRIDLWTAELARAVF